MEISFTEREFDVMAVLWEHGPSTAAEVRERRMEPKPAPWLVFDSSGAWIENVSSPRDLIIHEITESGVLASWQDSLDVEHVGIWPFAGSAGGR